MAEDEISRVSGSDIDAVASKLEDLSKGLSPQEQVVVGWLLERAASAPAHADTEVQGYIFQGTVLPSATNFSNVGAFQSAFHNSLGLTRAGVTVTFGVRVRGMPTGLMR